MARGLTALRAALGAVGGVTEALQEREKMKREQAREQQILSRQAGLDAAALRNEQREAIGMGMVEAGQFNPYGIAGGMDMPGATPRQPVFRQKIDDIEFVLPESAGTTKHRSSISAALDKAKSTADLQWSDKYGAFVNKRTGEVTVPTGLPRPVVSGGGKNELDDTAKSRLGRQFIAAQARSPALMSALQTAFADNPALAQDPGLAAYNIMKAGVVQKGVAKGYTPKPVKGSAAPSSSLLTGDPETDAKLAAVLGGKVTPAPAAAPAPTRAAPAAAPAPAAPTPRSSSTDQALEEERRLWDEAVAKYGVDVVTREVGRRP